MFMNKKNYNFSFLNEGEVNIKIVTTTSVIKPPNITDGTTPISLAASPDSNAPISFEEPMNMLFTAETLPFIFSGVLSCMIVCLITTLTLSNIPLRASRIKERIKFCDKPKAIMQSPNPVTAIKRFLPAFAVGGL